MKKKPLILKFWIFFDFSHEFRKNLINGFTNTYKTSNLLNFNTYTNSIKRQGNKVQPNPAKQMIRVNCKKKSIIFVSPRYKIKTNRRNNRKIHVELYNTLKVQNGEKKESREERKKLKHIRKKK